MLHLLAYKSNKRVLRCRKEDIQFAVVSCCFKMIQCTMFVPLAYVI